MYNTHKLTAQYIDPGMQAAVLSGIYGLSSEPPFNCPSGNCIWPAITALGLCSSCQNVTAETSKTSPAARRSRWAFHSYANKPLPAV